MPPAPMGDHNTLAKSLRACFVHYFLYNFTLGGPREWPRAASGAASGAAMAALGAGQVYQANFFQSSLN